MERAEERSSVTVSASPPVSVASSPLEAGVSDARSFTFAVAGADKDGLTAEAISAAFSGAEDDMYQMNATWNTNTAAIPEIIFPIC
jgi:hypothetical protein